MKKKVYIHIGHAKTGTSSIQRYLAEESSRKECVGFFYPLTTRSGDGHHTLFNAEPEVYNQLLREIIETTKQHVIISSECGLPNFRHFVKDQKYKIDFLLKLEETFDVKVIYYVRNHFEALESSYLQYTKTNNPLLYECFLADEGSQNENSYALVKEHFFPEKEAESHWINVAPTRQFDYLSNIDKFWGEIFGEENIITKVYHKDNLLHGDSVSDFISVIDPSNNFLVKPKVMTYKENTTGVYENTKPGFLFSDETRSCIKSVFQDCVRGYSYKYLDDVNSELLLRGF